SEQGLTDQRRHRDEGRLGPDLGAATGASRHLGPAPQRPQTHPPSAITGLAKTRRALVGRILEHSGHRARGPRPPAPRHLATLLQTPAHSADRQLLLSHPAKHLPHHRRLGPHHLVTRLPLAFGLGHIAVAIRRGAEHADPALLGRMLLATPAPLANL